MDPALRLMRNWGAGSHSRRYVMQIVRVGLDLVADRAALSCDVY